MNGELFPCTCPTCGQTLPGEKTSFDKFWAVWPVKVGKQAAMNAWKKLNAGSRTEAKDRAQVWFRWWRAQNPETNAIHASTYLKNRRGEDEDVPKPANDASTLEYYADLINGDGFIAATAVSNSMVAKLLSAGLVTEERMKARIG